MLSMCSDAAADSGDTCPESSAELGLVRQRLIGKDGSANLKLDNVPREKELFLLDAFTSLVDLRWRWTLVVFAASFFSSWLIFGGIYYCICYFHGDFQEENLPDGSAQASGEFIPCVWAIHNFASCFLFSVETQHTIGYGSRQTTEECPSAIVAMCFQSVIGVVISACMAGVVLAKLARPKRRARTIIFSKNALVSGDGRHLSFRVGNFRKSDLIESHLRVQLVTFAGLGDVRQRELALSTDAPQDGLSELDEIDDRAVMAWPVTARHRLDESSPLVSCKLFDLSEGRCLSDFELVVTLEGVVEPTGNTTLVRTSYLPHEILWGYRFESMVRYSEKKHLYLVDCSSLNSITRERPQKD